MIQKGFLKHAERIFNHISSSIKIFILNRWKAKYSLNRPAYRKSFT